MRATILILLTLAATPALADRTRIYSVQGADCAECGNEIAVELKKLKGFRKSSFDAKKVEITVTAADAVTDADVLAAIERAGLKGVAGPGQGSYLPQESWPEDVDIATVSTAGEAVGPLERLRVDGKYTVFDVYADWCGPCRTVDAKLRQLAAERPDLAVRKLNVVDFKTPLARELGGRLKALPYVVVFSPAGRRTDIVGADLKKLVAALEAR